MKDLLTIPELSSGDLTGMVDFAKEMQRHPRRTCRELAGQLVVVYLTRPSTRTRVTFATAASRLGAAVVVVGPTEFLLGRGAPVDAIARMVSLYAGLVVAGTDDANLERLAELATIPVVTGISDSHQPCQGLADVVAIESSVSTLDGLRVAFVGDGRGMGASLTEACALGAEIVVATPPDHGPDPDLLSEARRLVSKAGGNLTYTFDAEEASAGADVVYLSPLRCDARNHGTGTEMPLAAGTASATDLLLAAAASHAPLLVCQPAKLTSDMARDLVRHPRSRMRQQADNRIFAAASLLVAAHRGQLEGSRPQPDFLAAAV